MAQDFSIPRARGAPTAPRAAEHYSAGGEAPAVDAAALRTAALAWRNNMVATTKLAPRKLRFSTWSDLEVGDLLTPADARIDYAKDLGFPGEYPFTRGVQPT